MYEEEPPIPLMPHHSTETLPGMDSPIIPHTVDLDTISQQEADSYMMRIFQMMSFTKTIFVGKTFLVIGSLLKDLTMKTAIHSSRLLLIQEISVDL